MNKLISVKSKRLHAGFTVEAALLMTLILPALLALIYLGLFLLDCGVLNGASQEAAAIADLSRWKSSGNAKLAKKASKLAKRAGSSKKISSSVSCSSKKVKISFSSKLRLPGLLPKLFGKSSLSAAASASRSFPQPADLIRKIRGLEYVSDMLS